MPLADHSARIAHLRAGGTSVVLHLDDRHLPCVLHWGPDLGDAPTTALTPLLAALDKPYVDSAVMTQQAVSLLPQHSTGWIGRPGLLGSRDGRAWSTTFTTVAHSVEPSRVVSTGADPHAELEVTTEIELADSGLLRVRASVRNTGSDVYEVTLLEPALPVPQEADELLDMAGRHTHERTPQRRGFDYGQWVRESWGGRPGHESATVMCAGRSGFGFRSGRVWGVHLAYSGNQTLSAERSFTGWRLLRGGELLLPGEMRLAPGDTYSSPWLLGSWGDGLDAFSHRFHDYLRARPTHPRSPRPILLNTWEAVYFDMDLPTLLDLADGAADLGIERYVLDDGWFRHRRNDRAGLGDWYVDEGVWPDGLRPLVERVKGHGMQFGLWFEPEMVNLDSDLARAHPEWILQTGHGPGLPSRFQHVLDLGNDEAYAYILERMSALVDEYGIDYIKWDHNRALVDAGHGAGGEPGVHRQTHAAYRLMDELKARHPGLEIESCCGGGGRLDLGMLEHADRVWVSDCIDAHERQRMVRWTGLILPPELMGTHVGSGRDHTTKRTHELAFRAGTAMWGHMGVEWDLTTASPEQRADLRSWVDLHKQMRGLLHSGRTVHADLSDPAVVLEGVVSADGSDALFRLAVVEHVLSWPIERVPLPGLDPDRTYRITVQPPADASVQRFAPAWAHGAVELTGRVLEQVGIQPPLLDVDTLVLLRATAVD